MFQSDKNIGELHNILEITEEECDDDDLIEIHLGSNSIKINYSNLFKYSKFIRDE